MIKKIVFVFSKYFETKDWNIFNCPYFISKGYNVEIWSIVQIQYKGKANKPLHLFKDYEVKYFKNKSDLKHEIRKNNRKHTIFLIYPSLGENCETGYLTRYLIRQAGFQYCDYFYPPYFTNFTNEKIPNTWIDITGYYLKHLDNKKIIKDLFFSLVYPPKYIFMAAQDNANFLANKYDILMPRKLKYINSPDYENFITENTNEDLLVLRREGLKENKYIVFLDEAYTHHSDILNLGLKAWVKEDIYGKELCKLFDFIEAQTNMNVIIALHPKAEYTNSFMFGGRKMIHGESRVLIKFSSFVIADFSTAISYTMLYNKRLLMYTTEQLIRNREYPKAAQSALAKFLGCRIVNISKKIPDDLLTVYVKQVDEAKRKTYINRLVCSRRKGKNITSAQIINNCLQKV